MFALVLINLENPVESSNCYIKLEWTPITGKISSIHGKIQQG